MDELANFLQGSEGSRIDAVRDACGLLETRGDILTRLLAVGTKHLAEDGKDLPAGSPEDMLLIIIRIGLAMAESNPQVLRDVPIEEPVIDMSIPN